MALHHRVFEPAHPFAACGFMPRHRDFARAHSGAARRSCALVNPLRTCVSRRYAAELLREALLSCLGFQVLPIPCPPAGQLPCWLVDKPLQDKGVIGAVIPSRTIAELMVSGCLSSSVIRPGLWLGTECMAR